MSYLDWPATWARWSDALRRRGAEIIRLEVAPPAHEAEVSACEARLGRRLPTELRDVLMSFSAHVHFHWGFMAGGASEPRALEDLSSGGELEWNCSTLEMHSSEDNWNDDLTLHGEAGALLRREAIAFQTVANGDVLAIDSRNGTVVYFDHEGGEGDGAILAPSFTSFVDRYNAIGCSGPDWFVLEHLHSMDGIDPMAPNAELWRRWVGVTSSGNAI